jgi:hypothetical protein
VSERIRYSQREKIYSQDFKKYLDENEPIPADVLAALDMLDQPDEPDVESAAPRAGQPNRLRDLARELLDSNARRQERTAAERDLFTKAKARIKAQERQAKAAARRERDVARKRQERAGLIIGKRIAALDRATTRHGGDRFLVKMAGRALELARFLEALREARRRHGPKASLTEIAATYEGMTGTRSTKDSVRRQLENVEKLEAPGGVWHRWHNL